MNYYYIHGFNATGKTTASELSKVLEEEVTLLSWDCTKPFNENLENMSNKIEVEWFETVVMGSSMGGFYANALANKLKVACALFNPVMDAKATLMKLKDSVPDNITEEVVNSYVRGKDEILPRVIIVGMKDDVLNPAETISYWQGKCELITVEEGHHITDFKPFKQNLIELGNNIAFY